MARRKRRRVTTSAPDSVTVQAVGSALLVRTTGDPVAALAAMAERLPSEDGRVAVVTAPSITARPDLLDLVAEIVDARLPDSGTGVRLVAIGTARTPATLEADLPAVVERTGRSYTAPLGTVLVGGDGTLAVTAASGCHGGWVTCAPGTPPHHQPAWHPLPSWGSALPATSAVVMQRGAATTHPVPAGFWILPADVRPGSAGPAASLAPDAHTPTVFLGGSGKAPLPLDDVLKSLANLPLRNARIVLLPGALPEDFAVAGLRDACGPQVSIVAGVPVLSDPQRWELLPIDLTGHLTWRPVPGSRPTEPPTRFSPGDRMTRREPAAQQPRHGRRTPAGWSFLEGTEPVGVVPAVAGHVVEVHVDPNGFRIAGQPVSAETLAGMIGGSGDPGRASVIVVGHGEPPIDPDAAYSGLADSLDWPVTAADAEVSLTPTGVLHTSGQFRTWRPVSATLGMEGDIGRGHLLGGTLPPYAIPYGPGSETPAATTGAWAQDDGPAGEAEPPQPGAPAATPPSSEPPATVTAPHLGSAEEDRLRRLLDGRYDTHFEAVALALSEDPHIRDHSVPAGDRPTPTSGLVAVRAYCAGERMSVNQALRTDGDSPSGATAVLASFTTSGLQRLPVVYGPVFTAARTSAPPDRYQPGEVLVEPAFVDVDLSRRGYQDMTVEYLIWSLSARRLGAISAGEPATGLFPAGSRFQVLDVDDHPNHLRVLLLDLAAPRHATPRHINSGPPETGRQGTGLEDATLPELLRQAASRLERPGAAPHLLDFLIGRGLPAAGIGGQPRSASHRALPAVAR